MDKWSIIGLLAAGVVLLVASVLIRVRSAGKYEIKTIDLAFIVVPLLLVGVATGRLQGLDLFGVKADLSSLFAKAANTEIEAQVGTPPVSSVDDVTHYIDAPGKGGLSEIPRLIESKTEAISFKLGAGGYASWAIQQYFEKLYGTSYLKFIVIDNPDGTLFGVFAAADLIAYLRTAEGQGYEQFQQMVNSGDEGSCPDSSLSMLPPPRARPSATRWRGWNSSDATRCRWWMTSGALSAPSSVPR